MANSDSSEPKKQPVRKGVFRKEAIAHNFHQNEEPSHLLRVFPRWTRLSYWFVLAVVISAFVYITFGNVREYAIGPALIWFTGRQDVVAKKAGTIKTIEAFPGQRVRRGAVLVRLHDGQETADLRRPQQEFELQLVNYLRDPQDEAARQALNTLRSERDRAEALLDERLVKAPEDSVVTDLHVRLGQHVAEGDSVISVLRSDTKCSALALLPGQYLPQLHPGAELRMEMSGYRFAYHRFIIDTVADQVIGPSEARRYIGAERNDAVLPQGPIVLVWAHPIAPTFTVDGQTYSYYHGMVGIAQAPISQEKIIISLLPALRLLF